MRDKVNEALNEAVASTVGSDPIEKFFASLDKSMETLFGRSHTTVLAKAEGVTSRRIYSSNPVGYPTDVDRPMPDNEIVRAIWHDARPFIASTVEEQKAAYPGEPVPPGVTRLANIPIIFGSEVVGIYCLAGGGEKFPDGFAEAITPLIRASGPIVALKRATWTTVKT